MSEATTAKASQAEMEAKTEHGMRILERIEDGFDELCILVHEGCEAGMMTVNERDRITNQLIAAKHNTLVPHCDLTAIAERNNCDPKGIAKKKPEKPPVAVPQGGPGR